MLKALRQLFGTEPEAPRVPAGRRVYAIGDIHGRSDLFTALIHAIERDDAAQGPAQTTVILLGDLVDRGPDSAGVLAIARSWGLQRRLRILLGNHERMFLDSQEDETVFRTFMRYGGKETVLSYPIDHGAFEAADPERAHAIMRAAVPAADLDFIRTFEPSIRIGGYAFVHAGIRPGLGVEQQTEQDLLWIREPFLSDESDHGCVIVHGHTIFRRADFRANRIGIDTGAFMTGRLTALGLEGTDLWLIEATESDGVLAVDRRAP
jgi:serine/threonine protein phosphatase 1